MFEHKRQTLLPFPHFLRRLVCNAGVAAALVFFSLLVGALGYHALAGLSWVDSLLNASMILTGMGPVDRLETTAAKLFASGYALFSGAVFLTTFAVLAAPLLHRLMHRFHLSSEQEDDRLPPSGPDAIDGRRLGG